MPIAKRVEIQSEIRALAQSRHDCCPICDNDTKVQHFSVGAHTKKNTIHPSTTNVYTPLKSTTSSNESMKKPLLCYTSILLLPFVLERATARVAFIPQQLATRTRPPMPRLARAAVATAEPPAVVGVEPLVDIPMKRTKLPRFAVGREYVVVPLKIQGVGPVEFILDTGATIELITPHLKHALEQINGDHDDANMPQKYVEGLAAGGKTAKEKLTVLSDASVFGEEGKELKLPSLTAAVMNFSQEHMDPRHPVEGMLGMEMLELFDVDLDFPAGRIRFWAPGTAAEEAKRAGLVEIPTVVINESRVLATRVTGKPSAGKSDPNPKQPFIGLLDTGSTFSAVNWEAAKLLDLPPKSNKLKYLMSPGIMAMGMDNNPLRIPTKKVEFTFRGDPQVETEEGRVLEFAPPPSSWKPWQPVMAGIGDLPMFELLLGSDKKAFTLPAAIIGLDVLSQRRVILEASPKSKDRKRRMFVSPST